MGRSRSIYHYGSFLFVLLLQVLLSEASVSRSVVKFLPGFQGPLPFYLETGYVGVGESEDVQLFYYFVKSQRNPKEDPLLVWLTGGPGCSGLSALLFKIGPLNVDVVEYNGSLPTLSFNPNSWTQVANMIFMDLPVGTGFSYARTPLASKTGDFIQINQAVEFLRKWLLNHPEFLENEVYVGGDSYSGVPVPPIVLLLSHGNDEGIEPHINLKGYLLGNPAADPPSMMNSKIPFAHGMGLISDELYESLKRSCGENYWSIEPSNVECSNRMEEFNECISNINDGHILDPKCPNDSPKPMEISDNRRRSLLNYGSREFLDFDLPLPTIGCRNYGYLLCTYWANDNNVRRALHVRKGHPEKWVRCNYFIPYEKNIDSTIKYHADLGTKGYQSLIYSGDHDMSVPFLGTHAWIRSLNYSIVDDWRPWYIEDQVAGYTRTYSNRMTFATVKGGGHVAPQYRPAECFGMFKRWMSEKPL